MKRTLCLAAIAFIAVSRPAWAQQDEIARLRAELVNQQAVITRLLQRVDELEKKQSTAVTKGELEQEAKTEQDSVNSLRETLLGPASELPEFFRPEAYRPVVAAFCDGRLYPGISRQGLYDRAIMLLSVHLALANR